MISVSTYLQEYRPSWGYKKANDETKQWLIEVPDNAGMICMICNLFSGHISYAYSSHAHVNHPLLKSRYLHVVILETV